MRKVLLILLSTFVVLFCWAFMFESDLTNKIIDQSFMEQLVEEIPIAEIANRQAALMIAEQIPKDNPPVIIEQLPIAFTEVIDEAWIEGTILAVTEDILNTLTGEQESLRAVIDLHQEKDLIFEQMLTQLDQLSHEELMQGGIPLPQGADIYMIAPNLEGPIKDGLPDTFVLAELIDQAGLPMNIAEIQNLYQRVRRFHTIGLFVFIPLSIILYLLLAGIPNALKWSGFTLLIAGVVYIIAMVVVRNMGVTAVSAMELPFGLDGELLAPAVRMAVQKFMASAIICVIIGAVLAAAGMFLPKRYSKQFLSTRS